jgi:hypothetical protein
MLADEEMIVICATQPQIGVIHPLFQCKKR